jgi:hypothetical protein
MLGLAAGDSLSLRLCQHTTAFCQWTTLRARHWAAAFCIDHPTQRSHVCAELGCWFASADVLLLNATALLLAWVCTCSMSVVLLLNVTAWVVLCVPLVVLVLVKCWRIAEMLGCCRWWHAKISSELILVVLVLARCSRITDMLGCCRWWHAKNIIWTDINGGASAKLFKDCWNLGLLQVLTC